jgi:maleylacetoacetate isomerase/maleylpyruvate isomerase
MLPPRLYTYFRSGSSHRVRIGLALKGIAHDAVPVHLLRDGGEQRRPDYRAINPQARVPCLVLPDGDVLIQSPAILEYLEEVAPAPPLLPADPVQRAKVRGVAALIGCDIHPLNNIAVLATLRQDFGASEDAVTAWIARWITDGFTAVENLIGDDGYCFGPQPGMADVYLVPQVFAARRFGVPLDAFPRIRRVDALAQAHPAFVAAAPGNQADSA